MTRLLLSFVIGQTLRFLSTTDYNDHIQIQKTIQDLQNNQTVLVPAKTYPGDTNSGRVILVLSFAFWLIGFLAPLSKNRTLGTYVILISRMLPDLRTFVIFFVLFSLCFGVMRQALLNPNNENINAQIEHVYLKLENQYGIENQAKNASNKAYQEIVRRGATWDEETNTWRFSFFRVIERVMHEPFFMLYGEVYAFTIDPCFGSDAHLHQCTTGASLAPILMALFLLMANVLLLNILIAVFNTTYARVISNAISMWKYQQYDILMAYEESSPIPPPFLLASQIYRFFRSCFRKDKISNVDRGLKIFSLTEDQEEEVQDFEELLVDDFLRVKAITAMEEKRKLQRQSQKLPTELLTFENFMEFREELQATLTETRDMINEVNERVNGLTESRNYITEQRSSSKPVKLDGHIMSSNQTDLTDPLTPNLDEPPQPRTSVGSNPFSFRTEPVQSPFLHLNLNNLNSHRKREFPHSGNKISIPSPKKHSNFFNTIENEKRVSAIKRSVSDQNINLHQMRSSDSPNFVQNWVDNARRATFFTNESYKPCSEIDLVENKRFRSNSIDPGGVIMDTRLQSDTSHSLKVKGPSRRIRLCSENTTRYNYSRKSSAFITTQNP